MMNLHLLHQSNPIVSLVTYTSIYSILGLLAFVVLHMLPARKITLNDKNDKAN